jgi:hypothetical protein
MMPCTTHEAFVSPGWTLPVIITTFFLSSYSLEWLKSVIVSIGTSIPPRLVVMFVVSTSLKLFSLIVGSWN